MSEPITRRDFLNGASLAIGASLLPLASCSRGGVEPPLSRYYPPELTGMRGSHAGSFETAHALVQGGRWSGDDINEHYDLIVVGAGISGLSAAYFYQRDVDRNARILLLDNHDDFGGHAKRNEFVIDDRLLIGYGGTQSLEAPSGYPEVAKQLLRELGVDTERFYTAFDQELYDSLALRRATFFDKATFGADHLAVGDLESADVLQQTPLSAEARSQLAKLLADEQNYLSGLTLAEQLELLGGLSYREYLTQFAGIGDEVHEYVQSLPRNVWAIGSDAYPAIAAWSGGYPGFGDLDLGFEAYGRGEDEEPYIFHFPDGNASIARLLVRRMIPSVAPGHSMEDIVTARFDYEQLDQADSAVRIRLNSTVINAQHVNGAEEGEVRLTYVTGDRANTVTAGKVVMAGYHAMVPHICPELPNDHSAALSHLTRAPLVYTNVLIRNWKSFEKLGFYYAYCPGSFHHSVTLDFPVSLGDYQFPKSPDEPMLLHLTRVPIAPGLSAKEQFAAGRSELLTTPFETFERNIRDQLGAMLGPGGFDPARDIAAITVNRWPHGYAYGYDPVSDEIAFEYALWPDEQRTWLTARRRFGNMAFAGTDAASEAMTEVAIAEAHRAVQELKLA
ncbi:MAG: NAD(P)-binding protein [Gammaproteobacteria bacterium]|nr:NAD(P)-binding protein [Gammaproteobacteria bacterium]